MRDRKINLEGKKVNLRRVRGTITRKQANKAIISTPYWDRAVIAVPYIRL